MKSRQVSLHKRILLGSLMLSYVCGVVLGSFAHNLLHHFADNKHHHSLPCLTAGMNESPSGETRPLSPGPNFTVKDCDFKLALHNLCRPTTGGTPLFSIEVFLFGEYQVRLNSEVIWVKEFLASSTNSRGPPIAA